MVRKSCEKLFFLLLSSKVFAVTQDSLYSQLAGERGLDLLLNIVFASIVGITELMARGKNPDKQVDDFGNQLLIRWLLSVVIGILVFAITEFMEYNNWLQFALVGLAAWGGVYIPDKLLERFGQMVYGGINDSNNEKR